MSALFTYDELLDFSDKELAQLAKFDRYKALVLDFTAYKAATAEARIAEAKSATYKLESMGGLEFSYAELLQLATISPKKWYDMPEDNPVARINTEVAQALAGIQSREANALKAAIAESLV
jgi:hypothetical protein